jgi:hypothetical protein
MSDFPQMVYALGGDEMIFGQAATTRVVYDAVELEEAKKDGFVSGHVFAEAVAHPLDHDADGRKGGSRKKVVADV